MANFAFEAPAHAQRALAARQHRAGLVQLFKNPGAFNDLPGGVELDLVPDALFAPGAVGIFGAQLRGGVTAFEGGRDHGVVGIKGVERKHPAGEQVAVDGAQGVFLVLRGEQVHKAAAGDDGQRTGLGQAELSHVGAHQAGAGANLGGQGSQLGGEHIQHGLGEIEAGDTPAILNQRDQGCTSAAGEIEDAACAVRFGQFEVKSFQAGLVGGEGGQVEIVVFGNVAKIMQVHTLDYTVTNPKESIRSKKPAGVIVRQEFRILAL